jgi:hypothetical protein
LFFLWRYILSHFFAYLKLSKNVPFFGRFNPFDHLKSSIWQKQAQICFPCFLKWSDRLFKKWKDGIHLKDILDWIDDRTLKKHFGSWKDGIHPKDILDWIDDRTFWTFWKMKRSNSPKRYIGLNRQSNILNILKVEKMEFTFKIYWIEQMIKHWILLVL